MATNPPPTASIANNADSGVSARICARESAALLTGASARGDRRSARAAVSRPMTAYPANSIRPRSMLVAEPATSAPAAPASPPVSEYRAKARFRRRGSADSASAACSIEAYAPKSTLAAPSIPVSAASASRIGEVARLRSAPVIAINSPAPASVHRRPMREASPAATTPPIAAERSPSVSTRPIAPGLKPCPSSTRPISTADMPKPNARSRRAMMMRPKSRSISLATLRGSDTRHRARHTSGFPAGSSRGRWRRGPARSRGQSRSTRPTRA